MELRRGTVKWEVEVSLLQINLCSDTAAGRFLLAAQSCQLSGSELPSSQRKALCIDMQVCVAALLAQVVYPMLDVLLMRNEDRHCWTDNAALVESLQLSHLQSSHQTLVMRALLLVPGVKGACMTSGLWTIVKYPTPNDGGANPSPISS